MIFTSPSWVPPLPYEPPDSIPVYQFILSDLYRTCPTSLARSPFTCGISGRSYAANEEPARLDFLARALSKELGWRPNKGSEWDKVVGVFALNTIDTMTLAYATHRLSGIFTPASASYSASELEFQLKISGAKCLFTCIPLLDIALKAAKAVGISEERVYTLDLPQELTGGKTSKHKTLGQLIEEGKKLPPPEELAWEKGQGGRQTAYLCFSSGTSGLPKGVMISHRNVISNVLSLATYEKPDRDTKADPRSVLLGILPMSHIYGLVVVAHLSNFQGNEIIVLPRFEMHSYLKAVQDSKIQLLYVVPPIIVAMIKGQRLLKKFNLSSVESVISGAAPLGAETAAELKKCYPTWVVRQGYGLTETSPVVSTTSAQDSWHGSCGSLIPGVRAKLLSPLTGKEITGFDTHGELWVQAHSVVLGYLDNEKADRETFVQEAGGRWMRTGDEAVFRKAPQSGNEHLFITDRIKELIKVKGHQVAPAELEAHLLTHPSVGDCVVIQVPDEDAGEVPKAFIVKSLSVNKNESDEKIKRDIEKHVAMHKAKYKWLKGGVEFIDVVPKAPSGKILRRVLRDKERESRRAKGAKM